MTALDDISAERKRQIESEGWTAQHDDQHDSGELLRAGVLYMTHARTTVLPDASDSYRGAPPPMGWPWDREWWKPKDKRRDLVRAGALCMAEKERATRKAMLGGYLPQVAYIDHKLNLAVRCIERLDAGESIDIPLPEPSHEA